MNKGPYIFSQVAKYLPRYQFDKLVKKYNGDYRAHELTCYNQFLHLLFGQLTACTSLRDICLCLAAHKDGLFHLGFRNTVNHTTLSRANERRDYRIYEELGLYLIDFVRPMYAKEPLKGISVDNVIYAIDSTTISISIKLAVWAYGKYSRGAVKMHTMLDLRGSIPAQIHITDGKWHDNNMWSLIQIESLAIYTADKAYIDLEQMWRINIAGAYFVMRPKDNMRFEVARETDDPCDAPSIRADYYIRLTGHKSKKAYPDELRIVKAMDPESGELITFITNNFDLPAIEIANIYRHRWDIEVFFKWIKQNVVIKTIWGYSENAVKTQLWVAICTYLILAHIKIAHKSNYSITEIATLISVSALEKASLHDLLTHPNDKLLKDNQNQNVKELTLFD